MKEYKSFKEIDSDLKRFKLERDIAWEELKLIKSEYKEDLKPINWITTAVELTCKYSFKALIKKWVIK
jgi:hypothetical protein